MQQVTKEEMLTWLEQLFVEPPGSLSLEKTKDEIAAWDSIAVLDLMVGLEERFELVITDEEVDNLLSVQAIYDLLNKNGRIRS